MGALGDLPHGRWVRDQKPGLWTTPEQRSSLFGGLILAGSLALLLWRAASEVASGSEVRGISTGTPLPGVSAGDRRYALIVAVGKYDDASLPSLEGPDRGAEDLHDALTTHAGFASANIRRVDGSGPDAMIPTRGNVLRALHELMARIPQDGNVLVLVSFTGQGAADQGRAYLLPQDAMAGGGPALLASTAIDFEVDIRERLVERGVRQLVLLVDSTAGGSSLAPRPLSEDFVKAVTVEARPPLETVTVAFATSAGSISHADPRGGRSVFTQALVDGMRGAALRAPDGWITLGSLLRYVQDTVPGSAARIDPSFRQEPTVTTSGLRPDEIRFAHVAAPTASNTAALRCSLRAPDSAREGFYVFDVAATSDARAAAEVEDVQVVNGGLVGTPFGRPVPLNGPREWPIRRADANAPLLAIARTGIGQCAAYVEAAAPQPPTYRVRWQAMNAQGLPYREVFKHTTENRAGRTDVVAAGADSLRDRQGRISRVEYSCEGATCGWSRHSDGIGFAGDVTIQERGNAFTWRRRWEGGPAVDTYTAFYEMPVRLCASNCP